MLGAVRAEALRQLPLGSDEQRLMREVRRTRAERLEHLDLRGAVRDVVLTADDMRDRKIHVVDDARQQVQPTPVLTPDDWVGQELRIEALLAANQVVPQDRRIMVE